MQIWATSLNQRFPKTGAACPPVITAKKRLAFLFGIQYTKQVGTRVLCYSSIAQPVEHLTVNQAVAGSNPARGANGAIVKRLRHRPFTAGSWVRIPLASPFGRLAQLGERLPYKQDVSSSILLSPTMRIEATLRGGFFALVLFHQGRCTMSVKRTFVHKALRNGRSDWNTNPLWQH